jgi:hypothetical protein
MSVTPCECDIPGGGYCRRHDVNKTQHWVKLCRTNVAYFQLWEDGCGPGQCAHRKRYKVQKKAGGPGTELKKIIARWQKRLPWFDLAPKEGCNCGESVKVMDAWGPDRCEDRIEVILDKLEREAERRKLSVPFRRQAARWMVRLAIRRARRYSR